MTHNWDRGVLNGSSWHGLEEVGTFSDAASAIAHGERSGAWPTVLHTASLATPGGLVAPVSALVAEYEAHPARVVGCNGARYRATATKEWRELVTAAVAAGAKPTGTFSLCDGSRVLATFEVGQSNGVRTQFLLVDSFDGTLKLKAGFTTIRVVCANTLAASLGKDGSGMASLLHTATLETKVNVLAESISDAIKTGDRVRDLYKQAEATRLSRFQAEAIFDKLFPEAEGGSSKMTIARADGVRRDARHAAAKAVNHAGPTLATLWNAATYLVDRNVDGSARTYGESDNLNSLLFGARGRRLEEVQKTIEVIMRDGSVQLMTATEAVEHGADPRSVGRALLDELMAS